MAATTEDYAAQGGIRNDELKRWAWFDSTGNLHRDDDDLPAVIYDNGTKCWYFHGTRHRDAGPALEMTDYREWHYHGKLHRIGGPAVEKINDYPVWYWCIDGKRFPDGDDDIYKAACREFISTHNGRFTKGTLGT